jgi:DNA polymerase-3 subunit gamma/tau
MSYQVLARKYRPQKFSEVIGQDHVTRTLKNALQQERLAHGYIFSGHRGIGKTTIARILAMALNCRGVDGSGAKPVTEPCGVCASCTEIRAGNSVDVIEIDAATNRGIDEIRELREGARYRPARDRYKIYILDEAHQITDAAFNALLKTLEEPPSHIVFMMATTQPEDIPQTIRSRCQHFSFHAVKFEQILAQLRDLAGRENIAADEDALALLAEAGDGSVRDALSILDQAIASSQGRLTAETVRQLVGAAPSGTVEQVMRAVAESDTRTVLQLVDRLMTEGHSPVHFAREVVRFLRNALMAKVAGADSELLQVSSDERARAAGIAELFSEEDLTRHLQIMLRTHGDLGYKQEQRFHLELGLVKMAHAQRLLPLEQLLSGALPAFAPGGGPAALRAAGGQTPPAPPPLRRGPEPPRSISPFAADSARKGPFGKPEMSADAPGPRAVAQSSPGESPAAPSPFGQASANPTSSSQTPSSQTFASHEAVIMGSAAPASLPQVASQPRPAITPEPVRAEARIETVPEAAAPNTQPSAEDLGAAVSAAVEAAGHPMAANLLSSGRWFYEGGQPAVQLAASDFTVKMTLGAEPLKAANAAASQALGRAAKLKLSGGGEANGAAKPARKTGASTSRVAEDPIVQKMQEVFGAEIRTVIDYQNKK